MNDKLLPANITGMEAELIRRFRTLDTERQHIAIYEIGTLYHEVLDGKPALERRKADIINLAEYFQQREYR